MAETTTHIARRAAQRYARLCDHLLPNALTGLYLVGSSALESFRPGRSDIDLVAVLTDNAASATTTMVRLRALHLLAGVVGALDAIRQGHSPRSGTRNVSFVRERDLAVPVLRINPVGSHTGLRFATGRAFDVNPVMWKVLCEHGLAIRGPHVGQLDLDPQPEELRGWTLDNMEVYWRPWAQDLLAKRGASARAARIRPGWANSWGVTGLARMHATVSTGEVLSKDAAAEYALRTFDGCWHDVIRSAIAYRERETSGHRWPVRRRHPDRSRGGRATVANLASTAHFVVHVIEAANAANAANADRSAIRVSGGQNLGPRDLKLPSGLL